MSSAISAKPGVLADGELVQSALAGRETSFEELVRRYQRPIAAYVYRMVGDYDSALDLTQEVGAIGNKLVLDHDLVLANLQNVQDQNGLEISDKLVGDALDFDIEMETGTGKTYVYLRSIFELAS